MATKSETSKMIYGVRQVGLFQTDEKFLVESEYNSVIPGSGKIYRMPGYGWEVMCSIRNDDNSKAFRTLGIYTNSTMAVITRNAINGQ